MQPLAATVLPCLRSHDDPRIFARLEQVACAARLRAMLGDRRAPAPIEAKRAPLPGLPRLGQPPGPVSLTSSSLTSPPPAAWLLVCLHVVYDGQEVRRAPMVLCPLNHNRRLVPCELRATRRIISRSAVSSP